MSKEYKVTLPAHYNIYSDSEREFTIYFSEPQSGVNKETGLLLLIPGYGGHTDSNVYKKMRSVFADQYNLITIQCDYFGQSFMQSSQSIQLHMEPEQLKNIFTQKEMESVFQNNKFNAKQFLEVGRQYPLNIHAKAYLDERIEEFNDMGLMQALDHLAAIYYVMEILKDNNLHFNMSKVILYGHSHGAYLCHLCNLFSRGLFTHLIDNSAWLFPASLNSSRLQHKTLGEMKITVESDYLVRKLNITDPEVLSLTYMYNLFPNECEIYTFQGDADTLIPHEEKKNFCNRIENCTYFEITQKDIDGKIFKSNSHGLESDHLKLFDKVMELASFSKKTKVFSPYSVEFKTSHYFYNIDYSTGVPLMKREKL